MVPSHLSLSMWSFRWLSVSACPLSFPGVYKILNLCCSRSLAHLTCLQFSFFIVVNVVRFLWFVKMVSSELLSTYTLQCLSALTTTNSSLSWIS